ncbi:Rv3235 family protein [Nocardiopsis algeriensis]|uniref:Uncharacterized protein n=1 Tax=Nocardiopsis algeriensis TaxID=1478215 RepID=A0A841IP43_9ACTN|nr:Rv3235 family protein [Nocardiopsis algeriensis]MBB6119852.1 hypothetical protein [Nocardiopsis algeriensis]
MSHTSPLHSCPRPACGGHTALHRPVATPARTPERRVLPRPCRAVLHGHRTPADVYLLAQQVAEVLVGRRAPEALRDRVTVQVREELRRLRGAVPCRLAPRLVRVFHQPSGDSVEASAVIGCGMRSRAFAFRAHREEGRWVCTSLETDGLRR